MNQLAYDFQPGNNFPKVYIRWCLTHLIFSFIPSLLSSQLRINHFRYLLTCSSTCSYILCSFGCRQHFHYADLRHPLLYMRWILCAIEEQGKEFCIYVGLFGPSTGRVLLYMGHASYFGGYYWFDFIQFLRVVRLLRQRYQIYHRNWNLHLHYYLRHSQSAFCLTPQWLPGHALGYQAPAAQGLEFRFLPTPISAH